MKKLILLSLFISSFIISQAQTPPVNDACSGAIDLGTLPGGGSGNGYSLSWSPFPDNGLSPQYPPVEYTPYGDMSITATLTDNCETPDVSTTIDIGNHELPELIFDADYYNDCQPLEVTFSPEINPTPAIYDWNFGDDNNTSNSSLEDSPSHIYEEPGIYDVSLIITTQEGCTESLTQSQMIEVFENPEVSFVFGPQPTSILYPTIDLDGSESYLAYECNWFLENDSNSFSNEIMPQFVFEDTGLFQVTLLVSTEYGCIDTTVHTVIIDPDYTLFVPNAFSPNGDGLNDEFKPFGMGLETGDYDMWIYDRWGNMIFHTSDYYIAWDGRLHNCFSCPPLK